MAAARPRRKPRRWRVFGLWGMVVLAAGVVFVAGGCGKEKAAATASAQPDPDLQDVNRQLRRWILKNQRPPENFEDFAATAGMQIPPPPAGKKYAIDKHMHVVLVNR